MDGEEAADPPEDQDEHQSALILEYTAAHLPTGRLDWQTVRDF